MIPTLASFWSCAVPALGTAPQHVVGFLAVAVVTLLGVASWVGISTERVDTIPFAALAVYPVLIVLYLLPSLYPQ